MRQSKDTNTLLALAEQGDNVARRMIGLNYYYGRGGVEQNYEEAVKWFIAAEDKEMLGECYLHGFGVERDINKTIELWETACEEHCRYYGVMFKLAHLYGDGVEMEPDYNKALYWWYQLAENDSGEFGEEGAFAEAMYQLACYYYEGKAVEKNLKRALEYFRYTIELFFKRNEGGITISDEPDFIIHARKVLVKHGRKSVINKIKKAAQKGDEKAAEILKEFGVEFEAAVQTEAAEEESVSEIVFVERAKREAPIQITVDETVIHKTFGEGFVCETDGGVFCVEFACVGKKKFLNPEAFYGGYLSLTRPI